jgi:hypothetical protein
LNHPLQRYKLELEIQRAKMMIHSFSILLCYAASYAAK